MEIHQITIYGGVDKKDRSEEIKEIVINKGEIIGVVGPTGSGKSQLISDIEQLAQCDTSTHRQILINNQIPDYQFRTDPRKKMIAQLSQNMNFFADMQVKDFLALHAKCRGRLNIRYEEVIEIANTLTGEPVSLNDNLTALSGGQTRALMVADVAKISESPIVLIDEIENAGIRKHEALELLAENGKIIMVVTHDPVLALVPDKRIVMFNGGMSKVIERSSDEKQVLKQLTRIDNMVMHLRESVRSGMQLKEYELSYFCKGHGALSKEQELHKMKELF